MMRLVQWSAQSAEFIDMAGMTHRLCPADLLALAAQARDPRTGQRHPAFTLDAAARLTGASDTATGWDFTLADGRAISVSREAIASLCEPDLWHVPRRIWRASDAAALPVHDWAAVQADPEAARLALLQFAREGFIHLSGLPLREGEIAQMSTLFGPLRETNYGRIFDVRIKPDADNLADTALALPAHSDNPYRAHPPEVQLLHCLKTASSGGETRLVDTLAVAEELHASDSEAFRLLCEVPVRFAWSDGITRLATTAPVITRDHTGMVTHMRCNSRSLDRPVTADAGVRQAWWEAFALLTALLSDPRLACQFTLAAGDVVAMDNRRVLHGRAGFAAGNNVERHLQGAYTDSDTALSNLFRLTEARCDADIAMLGDLFASAAMGEPYGEAISIRDHMLQSAELAMARGLGAPLVAAALLHDIGWAMGGIHEEVAADLLAPIFGTSVSEPVRAHVAAKRYLVATRPDYWEVLSVASRHTLAQQGGAMNADECARFAAAPGHAAALELRFLDDDGKAMDATTTPFADHAAMLRRLAIRHRLGQRL